VQDDASDHTDRAHRRARRLDGLLTVLLLIGHATLVVFSLMLSMGMAMGTDACAYQACGDEKWVHYALTIVMDVAPALFLADLGASIALKATRRRAFYVPLLGCVIHTVLLAISFHMMSLAGPNN
jgi:hypothetical protein